LALLNTNFPADNCSSVKFVFGISFGLVAPEIKSLAVIVVGESGFGTIANDPKVKWRYRECKLEWIENVVEQCKDNGIPVFIKQLGNHLSKEMNLKDRTGSDIDEFPKHLQLRQFPTSKI